MNIELGYKAPVFDNIDYNVLIPLKIMLISNLLAILRSILAEIVAGKVKQNLFKTFIGKNYRNDRGFFHVEHFHNRVGISSSVI